MVADASVVLKWCLPDEPVREEALVLRQRHASGEDPIAVPELLLYEVANVLQIRWKDVQRAAEEIRQIIALELELHPLRFPELARAMELAHRYGITVYDAGYLALAQVLRCRFVTADERLLGRLKGVPYVLHLNQVSS